MPRLDAADDLQRALKDLFAHLRSEESGFFDQTPDLAKEIRAAYIHRVQVHLEALKEGWT